MHLLIFVQFTIILIKLVKCEYNFTYEMAAKCKEHIAKKGYNYDVMYKIEPGLKKLPPNVTFEMHFAVLAPANGHVLLSEIEKIKPTTKVYEFVIGGGSTDTAFSQLRVKKSTAGVTDKKTPNILSPIDFKPFWIRINSDGMVEFGKEGEVTALLLYKDPEPLTINYMAFASWGKVQAKYLYDCPVTGDTDEEDIHNSVAVNKLTKIEQIKQGILASTTNIKAPVSPLIITVATQLEAVKYNALEAKLGTTFTFSLIWGDSRIYWNFTDNQFFTLPFSHDEIYFPNFHVLNSDDSGEIELSEQMPITAMYFKILFSTLKVRKNTWCDITDNQYSKWPRDEYTCNIFIAAQSIPVQMVLAAEYNDPEDLKSKKVLSHEWDILSVNESVVDWEDSPYALFHSRLYNRNGSLLKISVQIRRKNSVNLVLFIPLLLLMYFLVLSFWTTPLSDARTWYYSCLILANCGLLAYLEIIIPGHIIPSILILYLTTLFSTLVSFLIDAFFKHKMSNKLSDSKFIDNLLVNRIVRLLFNLKTIKHTSRKILNSVDGSESGFEHFYDNIIEEAEDDQAESEQGRIDETSGRNFEAMEKEEVDINTNKKELVKIFDRILALTFSIIFSVLVFYFY